MFSFNRHINKFVIDTHDEEKPSTPYPGTCLIELDTFDQYICAEGSWVFESNLKHNIVGFEADLLKIIEYILSADTGSFILDGQSVTFLRDCVLAGESGYLTLYGQDVSLLANRVLHAEGGYCGGEPVPEIIMTSDGKLSQRISNTFYVKL